MKQRVFVAQLKRPKEHKGYDVYGVYSSRDNAIADVEENEDVKLNWIPRMAGALCWDTNDIQTANIIVQIFRMTVDA